MPASHPASLLESIHDNINRAVVPEKNVDIMSQADALSADMCNDSTHQYFDTLPALSCQIMHIGTSIPLSCPLLDTTFALYIISGQETQSPTADSII